MINDHHPKGHNMINYFLSLYLFIGGLHPAAQAFTPYFETSTEKSVYKNRAFFTNDRHQPRPLYIYAEKRSFLRTFSHGALLSEQYKNVLLFNIMYYNTQLYFLSIFRGKDWRLYLIRLPNPPLFYTFL